MSARFLSACSARLAPSPHRSTTIKFGRGLLAALTLCLLGPALAQTNATALLPKPLFHITSDTLGYVGPGFSRPEEGSGYIESEFAKNKFVSPDGLSTFTCTAKALPTIGADFTASTPESELSNYSPSKGIAAQTSVCTAWKQNNLGSFCIAAGCGADPFPHSYNMRAACPNGFVFRAGAAPRCDCPIGYEIALGADGQWQCMPPCKPGIDNQACYLGDGACPVSNPILPGIAAKVQTELDYAGAGAHPLEFKRSFRSNGARPYVAPGAWRHWVHNWGRRIETYPEPGWAGKAYVIREDAGQQIYTSTGNGTWSAYQVGDRNVLSEQRDSLGVRTGFQYRVWADDSVEHYSPQGQLLKVVQRNGWTHSLTYSTAATPSPVAPRAGLLISVKNHFGRELRLTYDSAGRLAELLPPGAVSGAPAGSSTSPIRYSHNEAISLGSGVAANNQPTGVTWQDGTSRRYHYEQASQPGLLTGITDELGVRIGTYTYTDTGRAIRTEGPAGTNAVVFNHVNGRTDVLDYSGAYPVLMSSYTWEKVQGLVRPVSVSAPCALCGSTQASTVYTTAGEVARSIGHDGRITFFTYDSKGRETERAVFPATFNTAATRPALSSAESITSTQWHATWRLPLQVAEPGKITSYTYDAKGNITGQSWTATSDATGALKLAATKTGSTYATGWAYTTTSLPSSRVERVDGVEARRWTSTYAANGNITSVTTTEAGATNSATLQSNAHGQWLQVNASNGAVAQFEWRARGTLGRATLPDYVLVVAYDARQLPTQFQFSSGKALKLRYDASGQPIDLTDETGLVQLISSASGAGAQGATRNETASQRMRLALAAVAGRVAAMSWLPSAHAQVPFIPMPVAIGQALGSNAVAAGAAQGQHSWAATPATCCGSPGSQQPGADFQRYLPTSLMPATLLMSVAASSATELWDELLILKSAYRLRKNLCAAGVVVPPGCHHAHHIVAVAAPAAQASRDILAKYGIDIDDWRNGTYVRCDQHAGLHTNYYYGQVEARLKLADLSGAGMPAVLRALSVIRLGISTRTFP